jgi:hypothetical protein
MPRSTQVRLVGPPGGPTNRACDPKVDGGMARADSTLLSSDRSSSETGHESAEQCRGLLYECSGAGRPLAEAQADHGAWHQIARLVQRG